MCLPKKPPNPESPEMQFVRVIAEQLPEAHLGCREVFIFNLVRL